MDGRFSSFLQGFRTEVTGRLYLKSLAYVVGDVDRFLSLPPAGMEGFLLGWVAEKRGVLSGASMRTYLAGVKAFCEYSGIHLNWRRILKAAPPVTRSAKRAPSLEEVRKLFEPAPVRGKFLVSLMASTGVRVGAFDYFTLRDFAVKEAGGAEVGEVTVYRGQAEQYTTYASTECVHWFRRYLEERRENGEELQPSSPLLRNPVNPRRPSQPVRKTGALEVHNWLQRRWQAVGLGTRDFKLAHGFRRFFKTRLEWAGMKTLFVEKLMGHSLGLADSYTDFGPELMEEYVKHQQALFIGREFEAQAKAEAEIEKAAREQDRKIEELRDAVLMLTVRSQRAEEEAEKMRRDFADVARKMKLLEEALTRQLT